MYRLGHGISYSSLSQLLGVSILLASETFNKVCRVLVTSSYDQCITLPKTDEELDQKRETSLSITSFHVLMHGIVLTFM